MANKSDKQRRLEEARRKQLEKDLRALRPLDIAVIAAGVALLLCFFFDWAQVYNTDYGVEVHVSGFSFALAALTGGYSSTAPVYGDISVPFYYYAQDYCDALGALTLTAAIVCVLAIALPVVRLATGNRSLYALDIALPAAALALLCACFAVGVAMNGSQILPVYCSGNPACSIQSYALIGAIVAAAATAIAVFSAVRCARIRRAHRELHA